MKSVVITGASSGIGKEIATLLIEKGYKVTNISRRPSNIEGVTDVSCDITNEERVKEVFKDLEDFDVLISNAGSGVSGAIEFQTAEEAKKQLDINFFGSVNVTKYAIPHLKNTKGKIIYTSSLAAIFAIPFQAYYSASKSALEAYSKALRNELKIFGVQTTFVRLGDIKTGFTANREKSAIGDDVYNGVISRSVAKMEKDEINGMDPKVVARKYYSIVKKKRVKVKYVVGFANNILSILEKMLPVSLANFVVEKLYVKK